MAEDGWFDGIRAVGDLLPDEYNDYLRLVEDPSVEQQPGDRESAQTRRAFGFGEKKPFDYTGSQIGYIEDGSDRELGIVDPREIASTRNLAGQRVTVRLTQALVVRYPGRGVHHVLMHLDAGDRGMSGTRYQFSSTVRSGDATTPAIVGQVLFSGLPVDGDGLSIRLQTINVCSEDDEKLISALQSQVFQMGLDLVAAAGPVVLLLSTALGAIATSLASRAKNRPVHDGLLALALDSSLIDLPKLRLGTYVLVQAPAMFDGRVWSWRDYVYHRDKGAIVKTGTDQAIPFNYVALGIARSAS